jgi:hypothetical protein
MRRARASPMLHVLPKRRLSDTTTVGMCVRAQNGSAVLKKIRRLTISEGDEESAFRSTTFGM